MAHNESKQPSPDQDINRQPLLELHGALLKNEQDVHLFEQLVFLDRRSRTQ